MCFFSCFHILRGPSQWIPRHEKVPRFVAQILAPIAHVQSSTWRLSWVLPSVQLSVLASSASVLLMGIVDQVCPKQGNAASSWLTDTVCDPHCWAMCSCQLQVFDFSLGVDTLRDELLSRSWCMINFACRGSPSYSIRSRTDPCRCLTHLTILFNVLTSVTSPSAVHGPSAATCLTTRCLDSCSSTRHHKVVTMSEHRHVSCARTIQTRWKVEN